MLQAVRQKADIAEQEAKDSLVPSMRTMQTCFHERMLKQQLEDLVAFFTTLR